MALQLVSVTSGSSQLRSEDFSSDLALLFLKIRLPTLTQVRAAQRDTGEPHTRLSYAPHILRSSHNWTTFMLNMGSITAKPFCLIIHFVCKSGNSGSDILLCPVYGRKEEKGLSGLGLHVAFPLPTVTTGVDNSNQSSRQLLLRGGLRKGMLSTGPAWQHMTAPDGKRVMVLESSRRVMTSKESKKW